MTKTDLKHLRRAIEVARSARRRGNLPFGALLVGANGSVLLEAENTQITARDCTGHAEANLLREAGRRFSFKAIARCTVYASAEPCAMCAGAIFWSGVRRVVYALSSDRLYALLGNTPDQLLLSCRDVIARGQRKVQVDGPAIEDEAGEAFDAFDLSR